MTVIEYCTEEVERQGHNTRVLDGIERVGGMLMAWSYALQVSPRLLPTIDYAIKLGRFIEADKNFGGVRKCGVRVGAHVCPPPQEVPRLLIGLFGKIEDLKPLDFYRQFLEIHPFEDGNGRTGKVLLNWLNDTLLDPIFPPNDFWGHEIRNP